MESNLNTELVLHKEAIDAIKKSTVRNEQRITRALIDCALTPSRPPPPGTGPKTSGGTQQHKEQRKCYMDENGRVMLLPVLEVDRRIRERSEREKAAQTALPSLPPLLPPPPPLAVLSSQLHKKLERMTEQHIPMNDPYANDDIVQVGDQLEQCMPWKAMKIRFYSNYCLCKQYRFPNRFPSFVHFFSLSPLVSAWRNRHQRGQGERYQLLWHHLFLMEY